MEVVQTMRVPTHPTHVGRATWRGSGGAPCAGSSEARTAIDAAAAHAASTLRRLSLPAAVPIEIGISGFGGGPGG